MTLNEKERRIKGTASHCPDAESIDDFAAEMLSALPDVVSVAGDVACSSACEPISEKTARQFKLGRLWLIVLLVLICVNIGVYIKNVVGKSYSPLPRNERGFHSMVHSDKNGNDQEFALFIPHFYEQERLLFGAITRYRRPPVILFLGGIGGGGLDGIDEFKKWFGPNIWEMQRRFPFVVVAPKGDRNSMWAGGGPNFAAAMGTLNEVVSTFDIDQQRVFVVGLSGGGDGAWHFSLKALGQFAAIAPSDACYRVDSVRFREDEIAAEITKRRMGIWCAFNAGDERFVVEGNRQNDAYLTKFRIPARFTAYLSSGHESHTKFYREPELYTWLLEHQLKFDPQTD